MEQIMGNNDLITKGLVATGINGFGRIGRLALRVIYNQPLSQRKLQIVQINDPGADVLV
jgi:glyceraldehyde-3-phosphate dehydrogenase/erythrose-4-phosphate dehydrogenase